MENKLISMKNGSWLLRLAINDKLSKDMTIKHLDLKYNMKTKITYYKGKELHLNLADLKKLFIKEFRELGCDFDYSDNYFNRCFTTKVDNSALQSRLRMMGVLIND